MLGDYPNNYMISSGIGKDQNYKLVAFDSALRNAKLANYNLLRVSSILPSNCTKEDIVKVKEGSPLLVAYGTYTSNKKNTTIASAVSIGIPKDKNSVGVIMEYSGECRAEEAESIVCEMARRAMMNHKIEVDEIVSSSIEGVVEGEEFVSVISAVAMW